MNLTCPGCINDLYYKIFMYLIYYVIVNTLCENFSNYYIYLSALIKTLNKTNEIIYTTVSYQSIEKYSNFEIHNDKLSTIYYNNILCIYI